MYNKILIVASNYYKDITDNLIDDSSTRDDVLSLINNINDKERLIDICIDNSINPNPFDQEDTSVQQIVETSINAGLNTILFFSNNILSEKSISVET